MKDDDFDFGFSTYGEDEAEEKYTKPDDKAQLLYDAIMPLLNNLKKDADKKPIIEWPNRAEKIDQFIKKLDRILHDEN